MSKPGRPTNFSDKIGSEIIRLFKKGKTERQVSEILGVARTTIRRWRKQNPEFRSQLKEAKDVADELVESCLFARATGYNVTETKVSRFYGKKYVDKVVKHYPPDVGACIFWLSNRQSDRWRNSRTIDVVPPQALLTPQPKKEFSEFLAAGGYPRPYPKQLEMMSFSFGNVDPRMLLGARGYGKTDYLTIAGVAYKIYLDPDYTFLIVTKSSERNTAILGEISHLLIANGVELEIDSATVLRVKGSRGKDNSVSAVTIGTKSFRGRHPDAIIMDDPVTEDDTSEATRKKVEKIYNECHKLVSNILIIGQPAHKFDLYSKLRPLVKLLEVPHGSIPELDHDLEAQRLAGVSEESIQASYFLNVALEGSTPFDKIKYSDAYPVGDSVAFIDPSFEGGDYTALTIMRMVMDSVHVVGFVYKKAWNHCIEEMVKRMQQFQVKRLCFETNSLGDQPIIMLRQALGPEGVIGKKSTGHKHSRIMAAGSYAHLIHLSKESDKIYINQVVQYEYDAENDDAPDSLASCLEWVGLLRGKL